MSLSELVEGKVFIAGEYKSVESTFDNIHPGDGKVFGQVANGSEDDVNDAVEAAKRSQSSWKNYPLRERGKILSKIASLIEKNSEELAEDEARDVGKTIKSAIKRDTKYAVRRFNFYGDIETLKNLETKIPIQEPFKGYIVREPIGVGTAIVPPNYPLVLASNKISASLAAGNALVVKPPEDAPTTILKLGQIAKDAGLPDGVLNIVPGEGKTTGDYLVKHPDIKFISFTGSTETGNKIKMYAIETDKKAILELGGKGALIVTEDVNIDEAVGFAYNAMFINSGQICVAGSRLLLPESIYDSFIDKLVKITKQTKVGKPLDPDTLMGSMISEKYMEKALTYIEIGKKEGAKLLTGGKRINRKGFYLQPTIFAGTNDMRIAQEEIFGPVLTVIAYSGKLDEALSIANDSKYGLEAGIITNNADSARYLINNLDAGKVNLNGMHCAFDPSLPFGGRKESGNGHVELGVDGLLEYTRIKSIISPKGMKLLRPIEKSRFAEYF